MLEFDRLRQIAAFLEGKCDCYPEQAIVLGSGLDPVNTIMEDYIEIPYGDIPYMLPSTVLSHKGTLLVGRLKGKVTAMMRGRIHLYEGHTPQEVVRLLRSLVIWGARHVILTNASGGIDAAMEPGDLMLITDQINLQGVSSLTGFNDQRMGERFPDMSGLYDQEACLMAAEAARKMGLRLHKGVYVGMHGPAFETPAEVNMLRIMGGSAVGMSTVLEAEAVHQLGAKVLGFSMISNKAASKNGPKITHESMMAAMGQAAADLRNLLLKIL